MVSYLYNFENALLYLEELGVADVLLPFLLIFTIVFAVLQKTNILGEDKKNFNVIIALVVGLSVVIPHVLGTYPAGMDVVELINEIIPQLSLVIVIFIMLLILTGVFAPKWASKSIASIMALISIIVVIAVVGGSLEWWESNWFYYYFGEELIALIIMILVFGLIIWFITREGKTNLKGTFEYIMDVLRGER